LLSFGRALPRELSGGMKMRCAIARAFVTHPALLLMDEPFAALDEVTRFKLNDDLLALKSRLGTTIVFVTHSVAESVFISTRIVALASRGGRIVDEIDIDPALPRDYEFRLGPAFSALSRRASQALLRAMGEDE
jgi:NitT/TauT family transport system ATP-binding protein